MTSRICVEPGCDRTDIFGRNLCGRHYQLHRYHGTLPPPRHSACVVCGGELASSDPRTMFCSKQCKEAHRRDRRREERKNLRSCAHCGVSLLGKRFDAVYCSAKCGADAGNERTRERVRANRKPCDYCGEPIPLKRQRFCSDRCKMAARRSEAYGLTKSELETLLEQHGVCAICKTGEWGKKGPQVDHDHRTGAVRGVLCLNCNNGLGRFNDDPDRLRCAANYLDAR